MALIPLSQILAFEFSAYTGPTMISFYMLCFDHSDENNETLLAYLKSIEGALETPTAREIGVGSWALAVPKADKANDVWMSFKRKQGSGSLLALVPVSFDGLLNIHYMVDDGAVGWINRWQAAATKTGSPFRHPGQ